MKILGSEIRLKENILFSLSRYSIWWIILLVTMVFDYLTTLYFVDKLGHEAEANQVVAWLIVNMGLYIGVFIGKLFQLVSVVIFVCLSQRFGNIFLLVIIVLNCWAVVMNTLSNY